MGTALRRYRELDAGVRLPQWVKVRILDRCTGFPTHPQKSFFCHFRKADDCWAVITTAG